MRSRWAGDCGGLRVVGGPARVGWRLREIVFCGFAGLQPPSENRGLATSRHLGVFCFHTCDGACFSTSAPPPPRACSTHSPSSPLRSPLPAASISAALAATCVCATLRTRSARAARRRVAVRAPAHAPVGHRAHVGRARAVGVDRGHPVEHAHRDFPRRHARHGAHERDRHAPGAVLAAARAAQGRPPAPRPAHLPPTASCEAPKAARCASSSRGRRETWWRCDSCTTHPLRRGAHHRASRRAARSEGGLHACPRQSA